MLWTALIPAVIDVLGKIIPDPQAAAEAKLRALELAQKGDLAVLDADLRLALGQVEVNKVEAAAPDAFRGGWRPAVGWVCVFGLVYTYALRPLLPWIVTVAGVDVPPLPALATDELLALVFGMLGLGGFRTFERIKGKA